MLVVLVIVLLLVFDSISISITSTSKSKGDLRQRTVCGRVCPRANARVVEWQTRTFEGRMPKGMRVQVPPRAPCPAPLVSLGRIIVRNRKLSRRFIQSGVQMAK